MGLVQRFINFYIRIKMEKDFWLERWEKEEIGFHEKEVNAYLTYFWHELNLPQDSKVFVPLCGKSIDMKWLREQGHSVIGVELSGIAAQAFFKENGYTANCEKNGKFERYEANGIQIDCGDFFDLCKEDLGDVKAVYDRAAMVALPPEMRERYVQHLASILPAATHILLITFDYPQTEMPGPPFAVSPAEIEALYCKYAKIRLLSQTEVLPQNPRFKSRGLTRLQESVFLLTLK